MIIDLLKIYLFMFTPDGVNKHYVVVLRDPDAAAHGWPRYQLGRPVWLGPDSLKSQSLRPVLALRCHHLTGLA